MRKSNTVAILAVLGILVSLTVLYLTQFRTNAPNPRLPEGLGIAAAEETARVVKGQGRVVLIVAESKSQNPDRAVQQEAFTKTLAKKKEMSLLATEPMEVERPGTMGDDGLNVDQFRSILQRHTGAAAFVSLVGFPPLSSEMLTEMKGRKLIVVGTAGTELRRRLKEGVVQAAIIPRVQPLDTGTKPRTSQEWFNLIYEIITPETIGARP